MTKNQVKEAMHLAWEFTKKGMKPTAAIAMAFYLVAGAVYAQTNTITGVTSELTGGLGSGLDVGIGLGVISTGIGLVVYLIRKGIKLRG